MKRILEDREKRFFKVLSLYEKYSFPILVGKINYPGNNKNTLEAVSAFNVLYSLLIEQFREYTIHNEVDDGFDGKSVLMVLNLDKMKIKKMAVEIEETHSLGRIFDIDVYEGEKSVSRKDLGFKERRCIVCGEDARVCARELRHTVDEVLSFINSRIRRYIAKYESINDMV
ncbi:Apo-citrate lyase phosphoribosyl-dephospho-CoA transferase [Caloramator mitchellensis]|uniref:citrate lyase holo-[acyl-carrier protein] synthase n=1 Tax=Caloramator mitchellensis TaxID=908809 RepID=A0A0R3JRL3_CALMK|nr:citrate lyase holo-[acyl-carrier protein] synthase [Caloramator mitchellensis]KRQ86118.1 Apo-citrate lyase phosphoribosyl-dephospho-CoA transferase [Caloramator mitchellensis]